MIPHQRPVIHLRPGPRLVHLHQLLERLIIRYSLKRHLPVDPAIHHVIAHRPLIRSSCPWHPSRLPPRQVGVNKRITLCATSCYKGRPQESLEGTGQHMCVNKRITICTISCYKGRPQESISRREETRPLVARRRCGVSLRRLGEAGRMSNYYAVAQCITRTADRLARDRSLRKVLTDVVNCINIQT